MVTNLAVFNFFFFLITFILEFIRPRTGGGVDAKFPKLPTVKHKK
jgi:hypothetical protein